MWQFISEWWALFMFAGWCVTIYGIYLSVKNFKNFKQTKGDEDSFINSVWYLPTVFLTILVFFQLVELFEILVVKN